MKSINIGLIGLGTVGTGVAKVLKANRKLLEQKVGLPVRLVQVADIDLERKRKVKIAKSIMTEDAGSLISRSDIHIVVELMGGTDLAAKYIIDAARSGKAVVTANKALLAERGKEIIEQVEGSGMEIGFEASVGGSIPVIKSLRESLSGNHIGAIFGIMNGTSNFILSKMSDDGIDFSSALGEAQRIGLAEADPSLDVEGIDSAHKLAILIWLSTGRYPSFKDIFIEGISHIDPLDIEFASEFGYKIKLLAIAKIESPVVEARVHPTMIPGSHLLATVGGAYNAFYMTGDYSGPVLLYGSGAGMDPTASAVVSDIVDIARNIKQGISRRVPFSGYEEDGGTLSLKNMDDVLSTYYLRFTVIDKPGVLSAISGLLGKNNISISSVIQKGRRKEKGVPIVILTHEAKESDLKKALKKIDQLDVVLDKTRLIRIESNL